MNLGYSCGILLGIEHSFLLNYHPFINPTSIKFIGYIIPSQTLHKAFFNKSRWELFENFRENFFKTIENLKGFWKNWMETSVNFF